MRNSLDVNKLTKYFVFLSLFSVIMVFFFIFNMQLNICACLCIKEGKTMYHNIFFANFAKFYKNVLYLSVNKYFYTFRRDANIKKVYKT